MKAFLKKILGSQHAREVKKLQPIVDRINEVFAGLSSLSDEELKAKTEEFRDRIRERTQALEDKIEALKEEKRHSEDPLQREALTQEIGELDGELLDAIQKGLYDQALAFREDHTHRVNDYDVFRARVEEGFFLAHWCGSADCEARIQEQTRATIRCIPFDREVEEGVCILCGERSEGRVLLARAY